METASSKAAKRVTSAWSKLAARQPDSNDCYDKAGRGGLLLAAQRRRHGYGERGRRVARPDARTG